MIDEIDARAISGLNYKGFKHVIVGNKVGKRELERMRKITRKRTRKRHRKKKLQCCYLIILLFGNIR